MLGKIVLDTMPAVTVNATDGPSGFGQIYIAVNALILI